MTFGFIFRFNGIFLKNSETLRFVTCLFILSERKTRLMKNNSLNAFVLYEQQQH